MGVFSFVGDFFDDLMGKGDAEGGPTVVNHDPQWLQDYKKSGMDRMKGATSRPYTPYKGQPIAGFSPDQYRYHHMVRQQPNVGSQDMGKARGLLGRMSTNSPTLQARRMGYDRISGPQQIGAQQVRSQNVTGANLDPYMNKYLQGALDPALRAIQEQTDQQMKGISQRARTSGAYGGSRHGVADALALRDQTQTMADTIARGHFDAFQNAVGAFQHDAGRGLQADMANQGANLQADMSNVDNLYRQQYANQQARLTADGRNMDANMWAQQGNLGQFNINQNRLLDFANAYSGMAGQDRSWYDTSAQRLGQVGADYQGLDQAQKTWDHQRFLEQRDWDMNNAQQFMAAVNGVQFPTTFQQMPNRQLESWNSLIDFGSQFLLPG